MSSNKREVDTSGGEETVFHLDPDLHGQVYCYKVPFSHLRFPDSASIPKVTV